MPAHLGLEGAELRHHADTLDPIDGLGQERLSLLVAIEDLEELGRLLDRGAIPGATLERLACRGQGIIVAVFHLEKARPLDQKPRVVGRGLLRPREP